VRLGRTIAIIAALGVATNCGGGASKTPAPSSPTAATIAALIVTGWTQPLAIGERVPLTATAIYSDGTNRNVTTEAGWESSNTSVAVVNAGVVIAVGPGATAIIARLSGVDGNQGVTVAAGTPVPTPNPPNPPTPPLPPAPVPPPGLACGVERWFVKTLADDDASKVNVNAVTPMSIRELNGFATHCSGLPERRTFAEEFKVFEVTGRVTYVAHEDDRDYHIAIEDPNAPGFTLVAELADTLCAGAVMSPYFSTLTAAEAMWRILLDNRSPSVMVGATVRLRGVGFYDFAHGQRGRSQNCIELHPIVSIDRR
jgi:hypothetical protein